jgi:hypothetical protein
VSTRLDPRVEIAFQTPPRSSSPVWTDVTDYVVDVPQTRRGKQHELNRSETGTGTLVLDNSDRRFDPTYTSSPYWPNVKPMKRCRIRADGPLPAALTVSGNEITDASRAANTQGDGRSSDSSFGIWEATTNLCTNGGFETSIPASQPWLADGTGATLSLDATTQKFGSKSLKVVTDGLSTDQGARLVEAGAYAIDASAGVTYTASAWLKGPVTGQLYFYIAFWTAGGFLTWNFPLVTPTSSWVRYSVSMLAPATTVKVNFGVRTTTARAETFWMDGVQLEAKPVATPYVHTDGGTAARAAARAQAPAALLNATQAWFAFRVAPGWATSQEAHGGAGADYLLDWRDDANNLLGLYYDEATNTWNMARKAAAAGSPAVSAAVTLATDTATTVIGAVTATQAKVSVDGGAFAAVANTSVPTLAASIFDLLSQAGASHFDGRVLWFACGTGTLTDADAAALFALGNTDPGFGSASYAAAATGVMPFATSAYTSLQTKDLFNGYVEGWPPDWSGLNYSETTITLVDAFGPLARENIVSTKASLTTALAGTNNDLVFTSTVPGPGGNLLTIAYVVSGISTPLSVSVTGTAITVNVGTNGSGAATSIASQIMAVIAANTAAAAFVTVANAPGNDGTGVVTAMGTTSLSGALFAQQLSGARLGALLDQVGYPAADRVIGAGASTVAGVTYLATDKQKALEHILNVTETEEGLSFIDGAGRFVFIDRHTLSLAPYTTPQFTFDDSTGHDFEALQPSYDMAQLFNTVTMTDIAGTASTVADAASQDAYWPADFTRALLIPAGSTEPADAAASFLARYKDPGLRFDSLEYMPGFSDEFATELLTRELGDRISVKKTPPGGGPQIVADAIVERIELKIKPGGGGAPAEWHAVYGLAPASAALSGFWAMDKSLIDVDAIASY